MADKIKIATIIRWIARIFGSLILAFFLFFIFAHIFGDDESGNGFQNSKEVISFLFIPISILIGLTLAFKWEGLGGIITIAGMIGFFIVRPDLLNNLFMAIPGIPGILYLVYWLMTKGKKSAQQKVRSTIS